MLVKHHIGLLAVYTHLVRELAWAGGHVPRRLDVLHTGTLLLPKAWGP